MPQFQFFFKDQKEGFEYYLHSLNPTEIFFILWDILRVFLKHPIKTLLGTTYVSYINQISEIEIVFKNKKMKYKSEINLSLESRNFDGFISFVDQIDERKSFRIDFSIIGTAVLSCEDENQLSVSLPK